jgi:hypothetical protein
MEFVVSISMFQNIDIYQQGYYQLRLSLPQARLIKAYRAFTTNPLPVLKQAVCLPDGSYQSKVFYIKYREEQVAINEIIQYDC